MMNEANSPKEHSPFEEQSLNEDQIDIKEIWRTIRNHRYSIIIITGVVSAIALYLTLTTQPIYQSTTAVMIKDRGDDAGAFVFDFGVNTSQQRLQNEIEILKSYNLHKAVVHSLIEDNSSTELALFGTRYVRKRYRLWNYFRNWVGQGDEISIVGKDGFSRREQIEITDNLRQATQIFKVRDADVLKISISSTDSTDAVFLANRVSSIYKSLDISGGQGELLFMLTFLDSQILKYEQKLSTLEESLRTYQEENQIYSLDGSVDLLLKELTDYEGVYFRNIAELEVAQERVAYLKGQLSEGEKALMDEVTNTNNPMIVALRGKIAELEAQKIQQMIDEGWSEEALQAKDYNRRIYEMKNKLTSITETLILSGWSEEDPFAASQEMFNKIVEQEVEVYSTRSRASEYKKLVDTMSGRLTSLPDETLQYARLEREIKLNENLYLTMKQKYEESRITKAGQLGKVRILDPALMAIKVKPNKKLDLLIGMMIGLAMGLGLAFIREFLDDTVKSVEQLERKGLTVLGIIPDMHQATGKLAAKKMPNPSKGGTDFRRRLITYEDPKSPVSESYRSLRTNITYASADSKIKSLIVSSPQPGEGKSTTTANLAIAFAQLRKRTLLIDADLRKPVQHNVFDVPRGPGLSEFLIGDIDNFDQLINSTKVDNLFMVSAGGLPPNPSELLGSSKMSSLVDKLEQEWDIILFDSPPIVAVTDASMISSEIDALVMVLKAGQTELSAVDRALDTIKNVRSPLVGVILNGANPETLAGKYSYYYSYYNYYYHSDDKV
jgi:capsular exopolysaccharide synthesis family protein